MVRPPSSSKRPPARGAAPGHRFWKAFWLAASCLSLGCHLILGDFEIQDEPDEDQQPMAPPCRVDGAFYCERNILYTCGGEGFPWTELSNCTEVGLQCDAVIGSCSDPTMGSTSVGGTAAQ
jgi:hypothetical protein